MISFRPKHIGPVLSGDERVRQGRAVSAAIRALGGAEAVRAFLNSWHDELLARPIDLAVESARGLARVEGVLAAAGAEAVPAPGS